MFLNCTTEALQSTLLLAITESALGFHQKLHFPEESPLQLQPAPTRDHLTARHFCIKCIMRCCHDRICSQLFTCFQITILSLQPLSSFHAAYHSREFRNFKKLCIQRIMWYSSCIPPMSGTGHLLAAFPSTRKHTQLYLKKSFHSSIQQSSQTLPIPCKKKSHQDLLTIFAVWNAQENKQDMWHNFLINHPGTVVN